MKETLLVVLLKKEDSKAVDMQCASYAANFRAATVVYV